MLGNSRATYPLEPWEVEAGTMPPLYVIGVYANPLRWHRRLELTKRWIKDMLETVGVKLVLVEVQHGERLFELLPEEDQNYTHIGCRASTLAWSKESAVNVGIRSLPADAEYVCWCDADVEFRDPEWAIKTVHALQIWPVVQPWGEALDLGPNGEVMEIKGEHVQTSLGKLYRTTGVVREGSYGTYGHPGYVWAATMEFLEYVGLLLDTSGLGAADHQMAMGVIGLSERSIHTQTTPEYQAHIRAWCDRAFAFAQGHLGYVEGRIEHWFHGRKADRKYQERWSVLIEHKFDPITDLVRNRYGIVEITDRKPAMRRAMERYYIERNEDVNSL